MAYVVVSANGKLFWQSAGRFGRWATTIQKATEYVSKARALEAAKDMGGTIREVAL